MTKPLALVHYFNLLPGTQIANRLHELGYRVQVLDPAGMGQLVAVAEKEKPILLLAEVGSNDQVCAAIKTLKANASTQHIPVLTYGTNPDKNLQALAKSSGASLLAKSSGILDQLPQLLDQILQVE